jgi:hypothetical protein
MVGVIEIEFFIGLQMFLATFQVMSIHSSYNILLGRPWIHASSIMTSSLH